MLEQHTDLVQRVHEALRAAELPDDVLVVALVARPNNIGGHAIFTVSNTGSRALDQQLCLEAIKTTEDETMKLTQ